MMWIRRLLAGAALSIGVVHAAAATPYVFVQAELDGETVFAESAPNFAGPVVSGVARSFSFDSGIPSSANIEPNPLDSCAPLAACVTSVPGDGIAVSRAEANGLAGALRARALVQDLAELGGTALAIARLDDTITFLGSRVVEFDIDLDVGLAAEAEATLGFRFGIGGALGEVLGCSVDPDCAVSEFDLVTLEVFASTDDPDGYVLTLAGGPTETEGFVPGRFTFSFDLGPLMDSLSSLFGVDVDTLELFAELEVFAEAENGGGARMVADNSAFLQMEDVISAHGYNYLGRQVVDPHPNPTQTPEPAGIALLALALTALGLARPRRSPA